MALKKLIEDGINSLDPTTRDQVMSGMGGGPRDTVSGAKPIAAHSPPVAEPVAGRPAGRAAQYEIGFPTKQGAYGPSADIAGGVRGALEVLGLPPKGTPSIAGQPPAATTAPQRVATPSTPAPAPRPARAPQVSANKRSIAGGKGTAALLGIQADAAYKDASQRIAGAVPEAPKVETAVPADTGVTAFGNKILNQSTTAGAQPYVGIIGGKGTEVFDRQGNSLGSSREQGLVFNDPDAAGLGTPQGQQSIAGIQVTRGGEKTMGNAGAGQPSQQQIDDAWKSPEAKALFNEMSTNLEALKRQRGFKLNPVLEQQIMAQASLMGQVFSKQNEYADKMIGHQVNREGHQVTARGQDITGAHYVRADANDAERNKITKLDSDRDYELGKGELGVKRQEVGLRGKELSHKITTEGDGMDKVHKYATERGNYWREEVDKKPAVMGAALASYSKALGVNPEALTPEQQDEAINQYVRNRVKQDLAARGSGAKPAPKKTPPKQIAGTKKNDTGR